MFVKLKVQLIIVKEKPRIFESVFPLNTKLFCLPHLLVRYLVFREIQVQRKKKSLWWK